MIKPEDFESIIKAIDKGKALGLRREADEGLLVYVSEHHRNLVLFSMTDLHASIFGIRANGDEWMDKIITTIKGPWSCIDSVYMAYEFSAIFTDYCLNNRPDFTYKAQRCDPPDDWVVIRPTGEWASGAC